MTAVRGAMSAELFRMYSPAPRSTRRAVRIVGRPVPPLRSSDPWSFPEAEYLKGFASKRPRV